VRLEAPQLITLVRLRGSKANPVRDVGFDGLTFAHSVPTTMKQCGQREPNQSLARSARPACRCAGGCTAPRRRYYIPSCGDWAIYRGGMVMVEGGAERLTFSSNVFDAPGGNALFAFGYMKDSTVTRNEFKWVGNSAIAFVGRPTMHDLTGGLFPQDNLVSENLARETGLFDFESSFYFEAVAGHNTVKNNVAFNGPRAAINFNDGGVGGTVLSGNLLFGHGRESSDHGAHTRATAAPAPRRS
jgi:hypothetical protein